MLPAMVSACVKLKELLIGHNWYLLLNSTLELLVLNFHFLCHSIWCCFFLVCWRRTKATGGFGMVKVNGPTPPRLQSHLWLLEYKVLYTFKAHFHLISEAWEDNRLARALYFYDLPVAF